MAHVTVGKMSRRELNAYAASIGIPDPEQFGTMAELRDEIARVTAASVATVGGASGELRSGGTRDNQDDVSGPRDDALIDVEGLIPGVCCLFERHPLHPGGEVFVTGGERARVAPTPAVNLAIRQGRMRLVAE